MSSLGTAQSWVLRMLMLLAALRRFIRAYVVDQAPDAEDLPTSPQIHLQMGYMKHDQELGIWGCPGCTGQALRLQG